MADTIVHLTEQEVQRIEAIIMDKNKEEALRFFEEVLKARVKRTPAAPCGSGPIR